MQKNSGFLKIYIKEMGVFCLFLISLKIPLAYDNAGHMCINSLIEFPSQNVLYVLILEFDYYFNVIAKRKKSFFYTQNHRKKFVSYLDIVYYILRSEIFLLQYHRNEGITLQ